MTSKPYDLLILTAYDFRPRTLHDYYIIIWLLCNFPTSASLIIASYRPQLNCDSMFDRKMSRNVVELSTCCRCLAKTTATFRQLLLLFKVRRLLRKIVTDSLCYFCRCVLVSRCGNRLRLIPRETVRLYTHARACVVIFTSRR